MNRTVLLCLTLPIMLSAAEPDWPALERSAVDLLQRYLRQQSINPPANTKAAAAFVQAELARYGLPSQMFPSGPDGQTNLLLRVKGRDSAKKPLLLLNHLDVVPVDRQAWPVDPFGGIVRDGQIWGRGSLDMKGIGVQQMMALAALKQAGITPARDIVMLCTADEETGGSRGIQWMIDNHFADINAEYVLDEGGLGTREVLAPGKLVFGIAVGEKQMMWIRLRAKGTAGHGSQPIPENANMILLRAIEKAMQTPDRGKPNPVVQEMLRAVGTLAENKFTNAIKQNTISLTTLKAGVGDPPKANVIPSSSEATLDCRLLPGVSSAEFLSEMRARINDPRVTVEAISTPEDPGASRSDTTLFAVLRRAILAHHPQAQVTPMLVPYGTDAVKLRKRGLTAYGFTPMVLDLATLATMHSDAERIPVQEFLQGIHIYYDVLRSDF